MKSKMTIRAKTQKSIITLMTCSILACVSMSGVGHCERIKDIVDIQGLRSNPLTGVGLVIGLAETGDTTQWFG